MKRLLGTIALLMSMVLAICVTTNANLGQFLGTWTNVDASTSGITRVEVRQAGLALTVQAWGRAGGGEIAWGVVDATAYAPSVSSNQNMAQAMTAVYNAGFKTSILVLHAAGLGLSAEVLTQFTDNSGRSNYSDSYTFTRGAVVAPLSAPRQLQPSKGSVSNRYPRVTTLLWQPVPGAASYTAEVDCYTNSWMTDQGKTYIVATGLAAPTYIFNFIGAQPGRWRVWAVGADGTEGPKSPWWEFSYTR